MIKKTVLVLLSVVVGALAVYYFTGSEDTSVVDTTNNQAQQSAGANEPEEPIAPTMYSSDYEIVDSEYGTQVSVTINESMGLRTIVANALPNHDTGEFPNSGNPNEISAQSTTYEYPLSPTFTGNPVNVRTPGVAINGVKFEPATAERATCESGDVLAIEAIQDITDLGLDFNNAHVQPTGEYHYHGISPAFTTGVDASQDLVHVGFAADGYLMYYSRSGAYKPSYQIKDGDRTVGCSYEVPPAGERVVEFGQIRDGSLTDDWEYVEGSGQLDECNGVTIDGSYGYIITDDFPYVSRCLMGTASEATPPSGSGSRPAPPR
ncbi:MAG: YHYH protein [Patescibacteria group bacterium]